jgi:hypothetical protein
MDGILVTSVSKSTPILSRVGSTNENATVTIDPNGLRTSDRRCHTFDPVTAPFEMRGARLPIACFNLDEVLVPKEARRIDCALQIESLLKKPEQ